MTAAAKGLFETAGAGDILSVRDLPFAPKAVIAWWSQQEQLGVESGNRGGIGFWTTQGTGAVAWASRDGVETIDARTVAEPIGLLGLDDPTSPPAMRAELARLERDGFTLRWLERPEKPWIVHYLAFGGPDLAAEVGWTAAPGTPQARGLALPAHDDQVLVFAPTAIPSGADGAAGLALGIGAAGPGGQAAATYGAPQGAAPGAVTGAQSVSESVLLAHKHQAFAATGRVDHEGTATIVDWSTAGPDAGQVCYLALHGVRAAVGFDLSPSRPGALRTKVGFEPEALLVFSWGLGPSDRAKNIGRLCIGGASTGASGCAGWDDRNTATPTTGTQVHSSSSSILVVTDTQTGDIHAEAALRSLDPRGFTLDWTASDEKQRQFAYLAFASTPSPRRRFRFPGR